MDIIPEIKRPRENKSIEQEIDTFKELIERSFDRASITEINSALDLMIELHSDQENRPDGKPYISHPLEIAKDIVEKYGINDKDLVIAALLHDSVEDQSSKLSAKKLARGHEETSREVEIKNSNAPELSHQAALAKNALQEIGFLYGDKVKEIVEHLSNPDFDSLINELKSKGIEKTKNQLYKEHVEEAIKNPGVCVIKYADFARNALSINNLPEGTKKDNLRKKYGPVIQEVFLPAFRSMSENHPLFNIREALILELEKAYNEQYLAENPVETSEKTAQTILLDFLVDNNFLTRNEVTLISPEKVEELIVRTAHDYEHIPNEIPQIQIDKARRILGLQPNLGEGRIDTTKRSEEIKRLTDEMRRYLEEFKARCPEVLGVILCGSRMDSDKLPAPNSDVDTVLVLKKGTITDPSTPEGEALLYKLRAFSDSTPTDSGFTVELDELYSADDLLAKLKNSNDKSKLTWGWNPSAVKYIGDNIDDLDELGAQIRILEGINNPGVVNLKKEKIAEAKELIIHYLGQIKK